MNETLTKFNDLSSLYGAKKLSKTLLIAHLGHNTRFKHNFIKTKSLEYISNTLATSVVGTNLQELVDLDIHFMESNNTYKGLRHKAYLPVRGQRTHTNAKTCKKKFRKKI